jgi:predicted CopG family antitoxin
MAKDEIKKKKTVSFTIDNDIYEKAKEKSEKENRSFSNFLTNLIKTNLNIK